MRTSDVLSLAFRTVRSNKLRTGITVAIIAFGIMALVGINTAIDAMKQKFTESLLPWARTASPFITGDFNFFGRDNEVQKEKKRTAQRKKIQYQKKITKDEAENFKTSFKYPSKISISLRGTMMHRFTRKKRPLKRGLEIFSFILCYFFP